MANTLRAAPKLSGILSINQPLEKLIIDTLTNYLIVIIMEISERIIDTLTN